MRWLFAFVFAVASSVTALGSEQAAAPKRIIVRIQVVEIDTGKLKSLGFDWAEFGPGGRPQSKDISAMLSTSDTDDKFVGFLKALEHNSLARTLAEPTIATLDGRSASLTVGENQVDVVPIVLGDGRIFLECRIAIGVTPPMERSASDAAFPANRPLIRLDSATKVHPGKTTIMGHARSATSTNGKSGEKQTVVLAQVDVIDVDNTAQISAQKVTDRELVR